MRRRVPVIGAVVVLGPVAALALATGSWRADAPEEQPTGTSPTARPVVDARARDLLGRAATAPDTTAYRGVQFVSAWTRSGTTSEVIDVEHVPGSGTTVHRDGTTHAPAGSLTVLTAGSPSITSMGVVGLLASHYSLAVAGRDRVAGRETDVLAARRPGATPGSRPVARFWLDRSSGLVLRREVYDGRGRTTRASAFVDITVGRAAVSTAAGSRAWPGALDPAALASMRRHGWRCPSTLPGPLTLVDARRGGGDSDGRGGADIVHLSYSDGIVSVSVFEQHGRLDEKGLVGHHRELRGGHPVWVRGAVPERVVWASGGTVFTVVADAPERTVDLVVAALPHRPAGDGDTLSRLGRGFDRVVSWFNPFS